MLYPLTHAWTPRQKKLIVLAALLGLITFAALIYSYERYCRGIGQSDLAGTWTRVDPGTGGGYYELRADGAFMPLDEDGHPVDIKARWYAGGPNIYVRLPPSDSREREQLVVWHIVDISRDQFRVRIWQDDKSLAVWRRMKPTPRSEVDLSDIPITTMDVNQ